MCSPDNMHTSQVLLGGRQVAHLDRNVPGKVTLPSLSSSTPAKLAIVVEAMGRVNFGCVPDTKGLQSPQVRLDGTPQASAFLLGTHEYAVLDVCRTPRASNQWRKCC